MHQYLIVFIILFNYSLACQAQPLNTANTKLKDTREHIKKLNQEIAADQIQKTNLITDLKTLEEDLGKANSEIYHLDQRLLDQQKILITLQNSIAQAQSIYDKTKNIIITQTKLAYLANLNSPNNWVLQNIQNPSTNRLLAYYNYLYQQQQQKLALCSQQLNKITALKQQLQQQMALIHLSKQERATIIASLQHKSAAHKTLLSQIHQNLDDKTKKLNSMQVDEHLLLKQIAKYKLAQPAPLKHNAKFTYPINTAGRPLQIINNKHKLTKFVIQAKTGTPVLAIQAGKVIFANWLRGYGLLIIIDHGHGLISIYGHNQSLYKQVDDQVNAGDPIASVGQSGGQRQPGLYFEIRQNTKAVSLSKWFKYEVLS